jgi:glycine cleavage system H protein
VTPDKLLFSETHEWVHLDQTEAQPIATIGITAFAIEALTDLVYMQLPKVGAQLTAGQPFGEIESVKAVSDLYSPVSGEVIEVNSKLPDNLEILNDDPYGEGWMIKVKVTDPAPLSKLMKLEAYEKQCSEEQ